MDETLGNSRGDPASEDAELVSRCKSRDPAAFRELYMSHRGSVWGVVSRMINNDADREEVVQDVFLQVFRSLTNFRGTAKLSTWVHRVAVNVTLQHIRKKGRRIKLHLKEVPPEQKIIPGDLSIETPEEEIMKKHRQQAVQRVLDTLPPKKRVVLVLADFEGKSSQEISEIVGAPALTVRTRLFYARRVFYDRLKKESAFADSAVSGGKK